MRLALLAMKGEMGCPSALTAKTWGFYHVLFKDKPFRFQRPLGSYVMENTLFKIPYPTAFHGQTGVEAAIKLHPLVEDRLDDIKRVEVRCHNSTMVILDKKGPLHNFADRDHCMQYMMAIGMIFGTMTAEHYYDHIAADPRIDRLREKMHLAESKQYEREYHDPKKRTNANSIQVFFKDGTRTPLSEAESNVCQVAVSNCTTSGVGTGAPDSRPRRGSKRCANSVLSRTYSSQPEAKTALLGESNSLRGDPPESEPNQIADVPVGS